METDQNIVGRILKTRIGLVQLTGGLGGQLTKLIPILDVGKRPKN